MDYKYYFRFVLSLINYRVKTYMKLFIFIPYNSHNIKLIIKHISKLN